MSKCYKKLILFSCLFISLSTFGQTIYETDLSEAFKKSKKYNKNLVIFRYDSSTIEYVKKFKDPRADFTLDSLFRTSEYSKIFGREFVIYPFKISTKKRTEVDFMKNYFYDFTPNFIVFSPDSICISYVHSASYLEQLNKDILTEIKDSISSYRERVLKRDELESKFQKGTISLQEQLNLIQLRSIFKLKSLTHLNSYALKEGELTPFFYEILQYHDLKSNDPIVKYFLKSEKVGDVNWEYYKVGLIDGILETAKSNFDKTEFENATILQANYKKEVFQKNAEKYPGIPFFDNNDSQNALNENQLEDRFNFYVSISDTLNIIKYGNNFANFLTKSYDKKLREYLDSRMSTFDYVSSLRIHATDSVSLAEKENYRRNKPILKEQETKQYNENRANQLNRISWNFFIYSEDKAFLKRALNWSGVSLKLNSTPEKINTYAHLLFALGHTKKAIRYQTKAVEEAEKEVKYKNIILELRSELTKFQSK